MSVGSILKSVFGSGGFFNRLFTHVIKDADVVAISVTQAIKVAMDSGAAGFLAGVIDSLFKTHIAEDILTQLKKWIPEVLIAELGIQGLPENPTEQDVIDLENRILAAFAVHDQKSKLYSVLAAQIYTRLKALGDLPVVKFADAVAAIEDMYQQYLQDKIDSENDGTIQP